MSIGWTVKRNILGALTVLFLPLSALPKKPQLVEIERMTWVEIKEALHEGRNTALVFNGGTEQRGPQNGAGGHNLIARGTGILLAQRLGNALLAPVIAYSPNRANPELPGTIGISTKVFAQLNEEVAEQLVKNGFKNVVLMGDHGGGQKELQEIAERLNAKYSSQGNHVYYCSDIYEKANEEFFAWLKEHGYPHGTHASIPDTSEMLYFGGNDGWVRKDKIATALGDPPREAGKPRDHNEKRVNNGISGDARRSTAALGKRFVDIKIDLAVKEINALIAAGQETNVNSTR